MSIKSIIKNIYYKLINPNKVAKISGVQFGVNCNFGTKQFGSEPYMIKIGDNFYSSTNVQFITHDGSVNVVRNMYEQYKNIDLLAPIIIGNNVFIGYGVIVLPGTMIGDNVIVGAGSVIKGELKSNSIYAGVPAKYICSIDEYVKKNENKFLYTKALIPKDKIVFIRKWLLEDYYEFNI